MKHRKKNSARLRKLRLLLFVGVLCVVGGSALLLFAAFWNPGLPPVVVLMNQSGIPVVDGIYFDEITIQNQSTKSVGVVVVIKSPLDSSPRTSAPVTVCGHCQLTVKIEESQPTPDMNPDYYLRAVENPDYVRVEYAPIPLRTFANASLPLGLSTAALGIVLLLYSRTSKR